MPSSHAIGQGIRITGIGIVVIIVDVGDSDLELVLRQGGGKGLDRAWSIWAWFSAGGDAGRSVLCRLSGFVDAAED